jgi:predicted hotdog family 3-hydroxylacyl-ACP dehydratase
VHGLIGKAGIAALIPHSGAMCLLDSVRFWDSMSIVCMASGHRNADHPLASDGRLDAVCGIEYAAQAMAVHGGLTVTEGRRPSAGYLASVRAVRCHVARLDMLPDDLEVTAVRLGGDRMGAVYGFSLRSGSVAVLEGRAAVVIDAERPSDMAPPA